MIYAVGIISYCFPPRRNIQASPNVMVNGRPVHRQGDEWLTHCCGISCHNSVTAKGSTTVFANGQAVARVGDPVACGSVIMTGSGTVIVGG